MTGPTVSREQPGSLRPIALMPGLVTEFGGADMPPPEVLWVHPSRLRVDESYQRGLAERSVSLIRQICRDWDWARFKPPVVVREGEDFHVLDGQHTAIAALHHPMVDEIPVIVATAEDRQARARAFLGHNRDRVAVTPMQMFHSAVAAGDEEATAAKAVADAVGVKVLKSPPPYGKYLAGETVAANAIVSLVKRVGPAPAKAVLGVLVDAKAAPILTQQVRAVEHLLFSDEHSGIDRFNLATTIRAAPHSEFLAEATALREKSGRPLWACLAIAYRRALPRAIDRRSA